MIELKDTKYSLHQGNFWQPKRWMNLKATTIFKKDRSTGWNRRSFLFPKFGSRYRQAGRGRGLSSDQSTSWMSLFASLPTRKNSFSARLFALFKSDLNVNISPKTLAVSANVSGVSASKTPFLLAKN